MVVVSLRRMTGGSAQAALAASSWSRACRVCIECLRVAHQPGGVVVAEHQALERERQLLGVEIGPEVTVGHSRAGHGGDELQPVLLAAHHGVPHRARLVVELGRGGDEDAAALEGLGLPVEPAVEEGPDPRLSPRRGQRRPDDEVGEPLARPLERLELQRFLGLEVREQPALAHPRVLGELADGEAGEPDLGGDRDGGVEDRRPGLLALGHRTHNRTIVLFGQP